MPKRTGLLLYLLLAAVFLVLHRAAYQGYFQDDEISALEWTRWGSVTAYFEGILTPIYRNGFRAVGFLYYHWGEHAFGLDFPKYVAVLQAIHLANVWFLWLTLRQLGSPVRAACAGCAFFALHMALFDAVWKPMYIFDVLCGTFCLVSLLLWARGHWILSFVSFWLAFQSKELAVMLPLVLVGYELWFGTGRWTRLAPFLAGALSFALQARLLAPPSAAYTFHVTPAALATTVPFYVERMFLVPYLGFLLPLSAAVARNRRTCFGLVMMGLFFLPLWFLPGRVFSAYCYVPFTGLAIALAGVAEGAKPALIAAFFLLWAPLDVQWLRTQRTDTLRQDRDIREWITTFGRYAMTAPPGNQFVYHWTPEGFRFFGVEGAVKYFLPYAHATVRSDASPEGAQLLQDGHATILWWDEARHTLEIATP